MLKNESLVVVGCQFDVLAFEGGHYLRKREQICKTCKIGRSHGVLAD